MIVTALINFVAFLFSALSNYLPSGGLPSGISDALSSVASALNSFNYLIPVNDLFVALGIVVGYEGIMWGYHALLWFWKKIPFIGR